MELLELGADELERLDERLVEGHRRVRGKAEDVDLEGLDLVGERRFRLEEPRPAGLDALAELVDLVEADEARFEVGIEEGQGPFLGEEILLGVADLLAGLEEADEAADVAGTATGEPRAAGATAADLEADTVATEEHAADVAETTDARAGEPGESGAAEEAAAALELLRRAGPEGDLEEEALPIKLERPQVPEERPLDDRQGLERDRPAGTLEERLDKIKIDERDVRVFVRPGKLPHDRIDDADDHRSGTGEVSPGPEVRFRRPRGRGPGGIERSPVGVGGAVATEDLDIKPEALRAHVEGREVERLELILPIERVEIGQADRRLERELDRPAVSDLHHLGDPRPPLGVVERRPITIVVPLLPALLPVDAMHVTVRRRVVGRHRRKDLIVDVVEPAPLVLANVVVDRHGPARVARLLRQEGAHLPVGLRVIAAARAACRPDGEDRQWESEADKQGVCWAVRHDRWIQAPLVRGPQRHPGGSRTTPRGIGGIIDPAGHPT